MKQANEVLRSSTEHNDGLYDPLAGQASAQSRRLEAAIFKPELRPAIAKISGRVLQETAKKYGVNQSDAYPTFLLHELVEQLQATFPSEMRALVQKLTRSSLERLKKGEKADDDANLLTFGLNTGILTYEHLSSLMDHLSLDAEDLQDLAAMRMLSLPEKDGGPGPAELSALSL